MPVDEGGRPTEGREPYKRGRGKGGFKRHVMKGEMAVLVFSPHLKLNRCLYCSSLLAE